MGVSRLVWVCPDCRDPTPTPALEPPRPAQGIAAVDIRELLARSVAAADQSQARMMCDPSQGASDELLKIMMSASKRDQVSCVCVCGCVWVCVCVCVFVCNDFPTCIC